MANPILQFEARKQFHSLNDNQKEALFLLRETKILDENMENFLNLYFAAQTLKKEQKNENSECNNIVFDAEGIREFIGTHREVNKKLFTVSETLDFIKPMGNIERNIIEDLIL